MPYLLQQWQREGLEFNNHHMFCLVNKSWIAQSIVGKIIALSILIESVFQWIYFFKIFSAKLNRSFQKDQNTVMLSKNCDKRCQYNSTVTYITHWRFQANPSPLLQGASLVYLGALYPVPGILPVTINFLDSPFCHYFP